MIIQTEPCQHCGNQQVEKPWTLCQDCRRTYAKTLHQLCRNMQLLQRVARHEYKLGEPGAGGKPQGGDAPAPINLHAQDMLDQTEDGLQDMWNETGVESRPRWQTLLRDAPRRLPDLCRASRSGHWLTWLTHACERIEPLIDRRPRSRRIVGMCPECGREVLAAKGETLRLCKCGAVIDVAELREQSRDKAEAIHLTKTPAGMSEWLRENYGYEVSRKVIIMWIRRGKLPSSKPVEDGYYEFSIREIVSMAMAYSSRQ
ncbi:hypothetical protein [Bifidobacterium bifidum]|uniref:hypothetical protein n=2 Tax=Bifidobacterium bifidum TaxID=1681 RepID=UPI0034A0EA52